MAHTDRLMPPVSVLLQGVGEGGLRPWWGAGQPQVTAAFPSQISAPSCLPLTEADSSGRGAHPGCPVYAPVHSGGQRQL